MHGAEIPYSGAGFQGYQVANCAYHIIIYLLAIWMMASDTVVQTNSASVCSGIRLDRSGSEPSRAVTTEGPMGSSWYSMSRIKRVSIM